MREQTYIEFPGTGIRVPVPDVPPEEVGPGNAETEALLADPRVRALLAEADRETAEGKAISADDMRQQFGTDEPSYDVEEDALYVPLTGGPFEREEQVDEWRRVAYAEDGTPVAVEVLRASEGVDTAGLPAPARVAAVARQFGLPVRSSSKRIVARSA